MAGFAQFIFLLFGLLFIWTTAGLIYAIIKCSRTPPPELPENTDPECRACAYLCALSSSISFNEQIILFPNLVIAYIACKIIDCECD